MNFYNLLEDISLKKIDCKIYIFGSYLKTSQWADLDILIIYINFKDISKIKKIIQKNLPHTPLDINFMSYDEEKYFDFISQTNAVKIFPLGLQKH